MGYVIRYHGESLLQRKLNWIAPFLPRSISFFSKTTMILTSRLTKCISNMLRESGLHAFAKSFGPCQPALSTQPEMNRNFSAVSKFATVQKEILTHDSVRF